MFTDNIIRLDTVDSTNARLMELARQGAAEGTAVIARGQTAGRGTAGRSFYSPAGEGLYLSVLLRPRCTPEQLLTLTGWVAAAVREAIERACGAPCRIKWLNDIYLNGRKLCGILTELSPDLSCAVVGVGINMKQSREDFARQGLGETATSLAAEGYDVSPEALEKELLKALGEMYRAFPEKKAEYLAAYRAHCLTLGRRVGYRENGGEHEGIALAVEEDFALRVDGHTVRAGTVYLK